MLRRIETTQRKATDASKKVEPLNVLKNMFAKYIVVAYREELGLVTSK
jgi:hypothetical protein